MTWLSRLRSRAGFRKAAIAVPAVVLAYALFGFLVLPGILKNALTKALTETLHRNTTVREVRVNPFELSVTVRDLSIAEREVNKTWISAAEIYADLQLASMYRRGPVLREIRLARPYVNVVRRPDGSYNFSDLIEEFTKKPKEESKPFRFSFNNIRIVDGSVDFDDGPKKTRHEVRDIRIAIPFLSNLPHYVDQFTQPSFSATVNGKSVSFHGKSRPLHDTHESVLNVNVANIDLPRYLEYLPVRREYEVPSAFFDLKGVIVYTAYRDKPPALRVEGEANLREVRITGKGNAPMVWLPMVGVSLSPSDVVARELRLAGITVKDPEIDVGVDRNGKLNLLSLLPGKEKGNPPDENRKAPSSPEAPGGDPGWGFSVDSIRLSGGKVRFSDASRGAPFRMALSGIRVEADNLTTEKGKAADVRASFSTESAESFDMKGTLSLSPVASEGAVAIDNLALKKYSPYYADAVRFDVLGGTLGVRSGYRFSLAEGKKESRLAGLAAKVANLRLRQREEREDFLAIPEFAVTGADVDIDRRRVVVGEVATARGSVAVRRAAGGELNVARLLPEATPPPTPFGLLRKEGAGRGEPEPPWVGTLNKVTVDRYAVRFGDLATDPPVDLQFERIRLHAENLSTERNRKGKVAFSTGYDRGGTLSLSGSFSVNPPSLNGKLGAKTLPLGRLQPYYAKRVKILLTGGTVSADGDVSFEAPKDASPRAGFRGEIFVNDFSSLDKAREEDFLKFGTLHLGGVEAGYNPTRVAVREVSLSDFYSRIIVNPDGTLNVQGIVAKEGASQDNAAAKPAPEAPRPAAVPDNAATQPPVPVRIDALTLQNGTIQFSDQYIRPNYSAKLVEIGGRVTGISSEDSAFADVDLKGKLGAGAPLEIRGKVNPLAENLYLDLQTDFRDIDLSPLSPYSGRYAGYRIEKGKLSLSLKYHIEKKKLDAVNKVFIDQFTFGEAVESPDATKLPVRLAVSLLKDRKGEIHLDLPVTGQTDDPKFSVWGVVWQIVKNLLVKAATSPFALLGAAFGGAGEQLSYLEFEPGSPAVPATGAGKLENLARVLADRPALKLEIEGHVDVDRDREGLRQVVFRRKVAARKAEELARAGKDVPALDNVRVEPAEYPKYLARAYKEEKFPKPRNFLGMAKDLPVPEMEKLMMTNIRVTDDDLRQLAMERASQVRERLTGPGKVEPERVFLVEPKTLPPERKEKLSDSRVDFRIR